MIRTLDMTGTPLLLERLGDRHWRVSRPFTVLVDDHMIVIPAGTETNLASIPRIFWRIWPPVGPWDEAAVVHDYLWDRDGPNAQANRIFRRLLKQSGNNLVRRWVFWLVVTLGMWWRIGMAKIRETVSNL